MEVAGAEAGCCHGTRSRPEAGWGLPTREGSSQIQNQAGLSIGLKTEARSRHSSFPRLRGLPLLTTLLHDASARVVDAVASKIVTASTD
jgi:hypothetical protein